MLSSGAIASAQISDVLQNQKFSAGIVTNAKPPADCQAKNVGRIMILTNIELKDQVISAALSNDQDWTKRGKLYAIESGVQTNLQTEEGLKDKKIISGAAFNDVPVGVKITAYLTSELWAKDGKTRGLTQEIPTPLSKACETKYFYIDLASNIDQLLQNQYKVCVHNQNSADDYGPKQTFTIGKDESAIEDYKKAHFGSVISLGPCQNNTKLADPVASKKGLQITQGDPNLTDSNVADDTSNGPSTAQENSSQNIVSLDTKSWTDQALDEFNNLRSEKRLPSFTLDQKMSEFAQMRLDYLKNNDLLWSNENSGHPGIAEVMQQARQKGLNVTVGAEIRGNAATSWTAAQCIDDYKNSTSGHYTQEILGNYSKIGIAVFKTESNIYHLEVLQ